MYATQSMQLEIEIIIFKNSLSSGMYRVFHNKAYSIVAYLLFGLIRFIFQ